ncbi:MAG: hypothetical protein ACYDEE_14015 [Ignavibacteriaceae bacterium]
MNIKIKYLQYVTKDLIYNQLALHLLRLSHISGLPKIPRKSCTAAIAAGVRFPRFALSKVHNRI